MKVETRVGHSDKSLQLSGISQIEITLRDGSELCIIEDQVRPQNCLKIMGTSFNCPGLAVTPDASNVLWIWTVPLGELSENAGGDDE